MDLTASPYKHAESITWLALRRMRAPLVVLFSVYSISVLGMVLIPGVDDAGNPHQMSFFHAIYIISYVATTIGFGELPYTFTEAQRLWVIISIYLTVTAWLYSIGSILALIQNHTFRNALVEQRFARRIKKIKDPFHLIIGYGEASSILIESLTSYLIPVVVIDNDPTRIGELTLNDQSYNLYVPGLLGDAGEPHHLIEAGLCHPMCSRVLALTDNDDVNLKVAITSKLLNPKAKVICRAGYEDIVDNLKSFKTDHILDAFEIFCERLALALHSPHVYLLHDWLGGEERAAYIRPKAPRRGTWVICGYGRFGKKLKRRLEAEGLQTVIIETKPEENAPANLITGHGTDEDSLTRANIKDAVGIIAGTDDDVNNLSIIMTARDLNPKLYTVARQNRESNAPLFKALEADLVMNPHRVLADHIRCMLTSPKLAQYFELTKSSTNSWGWLQIDRLYEILDTEVVPDVWSIRVGDRDTPALADALKNGENFTLENITTDPYHPEQRMKVTALIMWRAEKDIPSPRSDIKIELNDTILFCGDRYAYDHTRYNLRNREALEFMKSGTAVASGHIMRWFEDNKNGAGKLSD